MTVIDASPLFFHGLFAPFRTEAQLLKLAAEPSKSTTLFAIPASASAPPPAPPAPPAPPIPTLPPISPDPAAPPAPDAPLVVDSPPVPVGPVVAEPPPAPAVPEPSPPVAPGDTLTVEPSSVPPALHASKRVETTESPSN